MVKRITLVIVILCSMWGISFGHDYKTGIGLRAGPFNGLTIKHFTTERAAFEGLFSTRWRGFEFTGLYELHQPAFDTQRLKWFYGFGGHIGFWNGDYTYDRWGRKGETYSVLGIDGIIGLEYTFDLIPFVVGLDWKPAYNITAYQGFWADNAAFSIRFTF